MEKVEYLPIGSIVRIPDVSKKLMIIARAVQVSVENKNLFFDYGACLYPRGLEGDQVFYFQHADIENVVARGYKDYEEDAMLKEIDAALDKLQVERTDVKELRKNI